MARSARIKRHIHRCPKCRGLIYTKACVLCDGYRPEPQEYVAVTYQDGLNPTPEEDTPNIRVVSMGHAKQAINDYLRTR